jgi:hypothetical protein
MQRWLGSAAQTVFVVFRENDWKRSCLSYIRLFKMLFTFRTEKYYNFYSYVFRSGNGS